MLEKLLLVAGNRFAFYSGGGIWEDKAGPCFAQ